MARHDAGAPRREACPVSAARVIDEQLREAGLDARDALRVDLDVPHERRRLALDPPVRDVVRGVRLEAEDAEVGHFEPVLPAVVCHGPHLVVDRARVGEDEVAQAFPVVRAQLEVVVLARGEGLGYAAFESARYAREG